MSTKTMLPPPRRASTASTGKIHPPESQKRKTRDESFVLNGIKTRSSTATRVAAGIPRMSKPNAPRRIGSTTATTNAKLGPGSGSVSGPLLPHDQMLIAGYLAHEFLSRGTLLGQVWNPTRSTVQSGEEEKAEPVPSPEKRRKERHHGDKGKEKGEDVRERYEEVSNLLKTGGAHLPGIVNPSQLGRFLEL